MGPQEPYWRTNTSFSPPPSRWDFRIQPEGGLSFGSRDDSQGQFYGSSTSSNGRESRSWFRGNYLPNHQYSVSDGVSSPSEITPAWQWTPPTIQEISVDDYGNSSRRVLGPLSLSPTMAGTSVIPDSVGSTSSRSDSSEYDLISKSNMSQRNYPGRRSFMSKPIHPLILPTEREPSGYSDLDRHRYSSASCEIDFTDASDSDVLTQPIIALSEGFKCVLCERFLSQRSPYGSRRIVRSGDMPVAGVLSCLHVFHAECLEQTTPKTRKNDPPCPICSSRSEEEDQRSCLKLKNGPRLRSFREEGGPSRQWSCTQAGDCVERNAMQLLNRNRMKRNLSLKGNLGKEYSGKLRKSESYSSQSTAEASSSMKV